MVTTVLFALLAPYADWEAAYLASALRMLAPDVFEVKTVALLMYLHKHCGFAPDDLAIINVCIWFRCFGNAYG